MMRVLTTVVLVGLAGPVFTPVAAAGQGTAALQMTGDWQPKDGGKCLKQEFQLTSDAASFGLTYDIEVRKDTPPGKCTSKQWVFTTGFVPLGMSSPSVANWYYQGFFRVRLDGVGMHDIPATFRAVRTAGPDAMLEGVWATSRGPVYVRFAVRGNDDKLLMQVALDPQTQAEELQVELTAYPHGFQKPWNRHMLTAVRDVPTAAGLRLDKATEPWALYYDKGMRGGPCGLAYAPDEIDSVLVNLGPYSVNTVLTARPGGRQVTVALWDFTFVKDRVANRSYLTTHGLRVASDLAAVARADWLGAALPDAWMPDDRARMFRRLLRRRLQPTPFDRMTTEVVTPHIPWARPLPGGPVRALVVAPRWMQRETVELAQRLDMVFETVCFSRADSVLDPGWLYLYRSYDVYGYERKTAATVINDLGAKLEQSRDCLILSSFEPHLIPDASRQRIVAKVREGTGLLLLGEATKLVAELGEQARPVEWRPAATPLATLPVLGPMMAEGQAVWRAYTVGRGRIVTFGYPTGGRFGRLCLTPRLAFDDRDVLGVYDYYHSLVASAVLWAARRELPVRVSFPSSPNEVVVETSQAVAGADLAVLVDDAARAFRRRTGVRIDLPAGTSTHVLPDVGLPTGPRYVNVWITRDDKVLGWGTNHVDLKADAPAIAGLELRRKVLRPGDRLEGTVRLSRPVSGAVVQVEVRDSAGRLVARQQTRPSGKAAPFAVTLDRAVTVLHEVCAQLTVGDRVLDQRVHTVSVPDQRVDDYHWLAWLETSNDAVGHHILRQLGEAGVDWIDNYGLHAASRAQTEVYVRNAARHGLRSIPYATRIASHSGVDRVREPCLTDPEHLASWTAGLTERARGAAPYGPPGYTLGDENFLIHDSTDVCISPTCLAAFRQHLADTYGSLDRLNASWQTELASFVEAVPATLEAVKKEPALWPRWLDHRVFMDRVFAQTHALGREAIRKADPGARVGWEGVFTLNSWHGYDFYQLCKACDLVQVYATGNIQMEYLRSFQQPGSISGAWYNTVGNADEASAKRLAWHLLFHGCNSSWYWMAYNTGPALVFPDLRPTPQLKWLRESISEIRTGIGKLLLNAERANDGIALHYSQASVHGGTLLGRGVAEPQWGFARVVEDLGLQYDVRAYAEIASGCLRDYKVLLLPAVTALSSAETRAITAFVRRGGLVIADTVPGILDEHGKLLAEGQLDDLLGIARTGLPEPAGGAIAVADDGSGTELALTAFDATVKAAGAKAWAVAGGAGTPCVLVNKVEEGWAVLLNTAIEGYDALRVSAKNRAVMQLMARLLALADVRPQGRITADDEDVGLCETVHFADGDIRYVCIVRDDVITNAAPRKATVHLPCRAHVYDVRAKQSLGQTQRVETLLTPAEPKVFALLPYAVQGVTVEPAADTVKAGTTATLRVTLSVGATELAGRHCVHVEVLSPDGRPMPYYASNVLTAVSTVQVTVPAALNDPPGRWLVRATDVASGRSGQSTFRLVAD